MKPPLALLSLALAGCFSPASLVAEDAPHKPSGPSLRELYQQPPNQWPAAQVDQGVEFSEIAPLPEPVATDPDKTQLGEMLFFDPRLSRSKQISCASCHDPELAWTDGRSLPFGNHRKVLPRNTPSVLNAVRQPTYFWDGRAASLEELVDAVVTNRDEMHGDWPNTVERLAAEETYREEFARVFGKETIEPADVAHALAEFVRSIQSRGQSRFDQFVAGEHNKLTDEEIFGLHIFRTKASCMNCHHGPFFTDHQFHDLGLSYFGRQLEDLGRYNITQDPAHSGQFKTPSLRNTTRTAPYMHVGVFPLRGVLNLYNAGMPTIKATEEQKADPRLPKKSHLLKPLNLSSEEIQAIEAFLHSLEEPARRIRPPKFPPIAADN